MIEFTLENPTSYFLQLLGFYPLFPVNQQCVETHGSPQWTYAEHIVCNGPFIPQFRRLRDRTRLVKNPCYWNRDAIALETVDVLAVESVTTALNLYLTGQVDWIYESPAPALRVLLAEDPPRDDLNPSRYLNSYYYLLNTTGNPRWTTCGCVARLCLALDRREITERVLAAGEQPAYSLVPPGIPGYEPPAVRPRESRPGASAAWLRRVIPRGVDFPRSAFSTTRTRRTGRSPSWFASNGSATGDYHQGSQ